MGGRAAVRAALAALALVATAACSSSSAEKAGPTATVATEVPTTATTNPYAVPAVIDAAYVNRVLAGLDAAVGDIVRLVVRTKTIPPEAVDRMKAVYADPNRLQRSIDGFQRDIRAGLAGYKPVPGNKLTVVAELLTATSQCIFVRVQRDYSAVSTDTSALRNPQWVGLRPIGPISNRLGYNPTPWAFVYDGFPSDVSTSPANPCTS